MRTCPGFSEAPIDVVEAVLQRRREIRRGGLQPLNRIGDLEGCKRHADGSVTDAEGLQAGVPVAGRAAGSAWPAIRPMAARACRLFSRCCSSEYASPPTSPSAMYPGLTNGAIAALTVHGNDDAEDALSAENDERPMDGDDEPDRAALRHRPRPDQDQGGSAATAPTRITGQKIFISAGEHDLADNIVHLVLARIEGAPAGVKGISLFLAPKIMPDADGSLGERNGVVCGSIEHKMGIHGNSTCVLNYDGAEVG